MVIGITEFVPTIPGEDIQFRIHMQRVSSQNLFAPLHADILNKCGAVSGLAVVSPVRGEDRLTLPEFHIPSEELGRISLFVSYIFQLVCMDQSESILRSDSRK